jgi:hypothetical protein
MRFIVARGPPSWPARVRGASLFRVEARVAAVTITPRPQQLLLAHGSRLRVAMVALVLLASAACLGPKDDESEPAYVCEAIEAPTACPEPAPTYADLRPMLDTRCVQPCHSGTPNGPWPLTQYQHLYDWKDDVRSRLLDCGMPPLDGGVPITTDERLAILNWIRCGLPQ